jgi:hypothetical protein
MSAFGGARGVGAKPPEKGIFPLDHFGECKQVRVCFWCGCVQAVRCARVRAQTNTCGDAAAGARVCVGGGGGKRRTHVL